MCFSAAILAGGLNSRFGGMLKSLALLKGETIITHQLRALEGIFEEITIITNAPESFSQYSQLTKYTDIYLGLGPISGIHSALINAKYEGVFIVAGDMPFLDTKIIEKIMVKFQEVKPQALIPRTVRGIEPLHGIYSKNCLEIIENTIVNKTNLSMSYVLSQLKTEYLQFDNTNSFVNINTPAQIEEYEAS